jgi:predicted AAA+ superfamily ATPase
MGLPYKFIVSGSGSMDLKAKIKESIAGRKLIFEIYPVSLREFINHRTDYRYTDRLSDFFSIERNQANILLFEYMNFGGYPRVVLADDSEDRLRNMDEIYQSYGYFSLQVGNPILV